MNVDETKPQRVAVIGSGISGLTAAYLLHEYGGKAASGESRYDVHVYESNSRIGGHTATIPVDTPNGTLNIDTGFIVYNDWTYPNFIRLLDELDVKNQPTDMTFSVSCSESGLEYSGDNLNTLFAQRRNVFNLKYWQMLLNIVRFNKQAVLDLEGQRLNANTTLGEYLSENNYSGLFVSHYLVPMCAAIWSASHDAVLKMPLVFFVRFFKNHGLLSVNNRPQWRVIRGGSSQYLAPLTQSFKEAITTNANIVEIKRDDVGVDIRFDSGKVERFDQVVMACHSDQVIALLSDISELEMSLLSAIPYSNNSVALHTDTRMLPNNKKTWAAWNYCLTEEKQNTAILTYNMNILQGFDCEETYCVTLNAQERIDPDKIIGEFNYSHPIFSMDSIEAQQRWGQINGVNRTWFCGAYWGNGFHEDGVVSAKRIAEAMGVVWERS